MQILMGQPNQDADSISLASLAESVATSFATCYVTQQRAEAISGKLCGVKYARWVHICPLGESRHSHTVACCHCALKC
jgi:hypothetical protein